MTDALLNFIKEKRTVYKKSLRDELLQIPGLGKTKIKDLLAHGLKTVQQLRNKKFFGTLPLETQLHLVHKPVKKIPYTYIKKIELLIKDILPKTDTTIVGSYRRKKRYSKDVDVMIVSEDTKILDKFIKNFEKKYPGSMWIYSSGSDKISAIVKLLNKKFKMDIFRVSPKYAPAMLLYATGSKIHNIKMRRKAKQKGLMLNQLGLYDGPKRMNISNERDIFKLLGMEYKPPEKRD